MKTESALVEVLLGEAEFSVIESLDAAVETLTGRGAVLLSLGEDPDFGHLGVGAQAGGKFGFGANTLEAMWDLIDRLRDA